jgi:hypothetical protein
VATPPLVTGSKARGAWGAPKAAPETVLSFIVGQSFRFLRSPYISKKANAIAGVQIILLAG